MSPTCPVCKQPCGFVYNGGGWIDPKAQEFFDQLDEEMGGFAKLCQQFEGNMIKCHWSRYGEGKCMGCGAKVWNDMMGGYVEWKGKQKHVDWQYYFQPRENRPLEPLQNRRSRPHER
jgi:hypothetical protein